MQGRLWRCTMGAGVKLQQALVVRKVFNLHISPWFEPKSFSYRVDSLLAASPCWENVSE